MRVDISHVEPETALLGPYTRFCVWVHGCSRGCPGCIAADMNARPPIVADTHELAEAYFKTDCEGLTISGGEPFAQPLALLALVEEIRGARDAGVIIYTGYYIEELYKNEDMAALARIADVIIDGPYVRALDDGRAYVGSSNQHIHYVTPRYFEAAANYYSKPGRRAEIKVSADGAALIGVPSKDALAAWNHLKLKLRI